MHLRELTVMSGSPTRRNIMNTDIFLPISIFFLFFSFFLFFLGLFLLFFPVNSLLPIVPKINQQQQTNSHVQTAISVHHHKSPPKTFAQAQG